MQEPSHDQIAFQYFKSNPRELLSVDDICEVLDVSNRDLVKKLLIRLTKQEKIRRTLYKDHYYYEDYKLF